MQVFIVLYSPKPFEAPLNKEVMVGADGDHDSGEGYGPYECDHVKDPEEWAGGETYHSNTINDLG